MSPSGSRITAARLWRLLQELPERYTAVLPHLAAARVLSGAHLDRLLADEATSLETVGRVRRRILARLTEAGLVSTLQRRIGGARAGSAGLVYALTAAGHKFLALLAGQPMPGRIRHSRTPSVMFLAHSLDIAEIYVQLTEASRDRADFTVPTFRTEPATWWPTADSRHLRPDAYTVLDAGSHQDCWWLEIDRATESPNRLALQIRDYITHATTSGTGPDSYLPGVLFTAPDQQRTNVIRAVIDATPGSDAVLFNVTTHQQAVEVLLAELARPFSESNDHDR